MWLLVMNLKINCEKVPSGISATYPSQSVQTNNSGTTRAFGSLMNFFSGFT
jgi:hypothetical protein